MRPPESFLQELKSRGPIVPSHFAYNFPRIVPLYDLEPLCSPPAFIFSPCNVQASAVHTSPALSFLRYDYLQKRFRILFSFGRLVSFFDFPCGDGKSGDLAPSCFPAPVKTHAPSSYFFISLPSLKDCFLPVKLPLYFFSPCTFATFLFIAWRYTHGLPLSLPSHPF